jgi:hypothetical protein
MQLRAKKSGQNNLFGIVCFSRASTGRMVRSKSSRLAKRSEEAGDILLFWFPCPEYDLLRIPKFAHSHDRSHAFPMQIPIDREPSVLELIAATIAISFSPNFFVEIGPASVLG